MGKMQRTKGHSFERWVATQLRAVFPKARRHLENHEEDASRGADLIFTGPLRVQCKRRVKYARIAEIKEVQADPLVGEIPILVTRGDNEKAMVVLSLDDFLGFLSRLYIKP